MHTHTRTSFVVAPTCHHLQTKLHLDCDRDLDLITSSSDASGRLRLVLRDMPRGAAAAD